MLKVEPAGSSHGLVLRDKKKAVKNFRAFWPLAFGRCSCHVLRPGSPWKEQIGGPKVPEGYIIERQLVKSRLEIFLKFCFCFRHRNFILHFIQTCKWDKEIGTRRMTTKESGLERLCYMAYVYMCGLCINSTIYSPFSWIFSFFPIFRHYK